MPKEGAPQGAFLIYTYIYSNSNNNSNDNDNDNDNDSNQLWYDDTDGFPKQSKKHIYYAIT